MAVQVPRTCREVINELIQKDPRFRNDYRYAMETFLITMGFDSDQFELISILDSMGKTIIIHFREDKLRASQEPIRQQIAAELGVSDYKL